MQAAPSILSTKPLREEEKALVQSLGWNLREETFIEIHSLFRYQWSASMEGIQAFIKSIRTLDAQTIVIFTSENGVRYLPWAHFPRTDPMTALLPPYDTALWQVACLAGKTLSAVREHFREEQVVCTAKNAKDLAKAIIADGRFSKAFFFCALEHRPDLPQLLREAAIVPTTIPVYETTGTPRCIDTPYDAVLFFSPSAVDSFFQLNTLPPGVACFAIGETTADTIRDYTDHRIVVSPFPNQKDLLACVRFYYDNQQCYE